MQQPQNLLTQTTMPASKLLMLQQNHINEPATIMSTNASSTTAPYINGQQNGNTKVVLVTSEPMEIEHSRNGKTTSSTSNGTDEELTSLTWLHDKNLLKGNTNYAIKIKINIRTNVSTKQNA